MALLSIRGRCRAYRAFLGSGGAYLGMRSSATRLGLFLYQNPS